jgi:hypothetical protein
MKVFKLPILAIIGYFALASVAVHADPEFIVKDTEWYMVDGGKTTEAPTPNGSQEVGDGWMHWLYVDPGKSESVKGSPQGLHFFDARSGKYSFLAYGEAGTSVNGVHFSPNGARMFIVESTSPAVENHILLALYLFEDKTSLFRIPNGGAPPFWIDPARFAYSFYVPETVRAEVDGSSTEWMSVAMYDTGSGKVTVLRDATATTDELLMGIGEDAEINDQKVLVVWEAYVASPSDWAIGDSDYREVKIPVSTLP